MLGLLATRVDNKVVEDIHAPLRLATKGNSNDKLSSQTMRDIINRSNEMGSCGATHRVVVTKEAFIREFANTPVKSQAMAHEASRHKLPHEFSRILRPGFRPWPALTDDSILKAVACWNWVHAFFS